MRILLVDDHVLFREGLVGLIDAQPDMEVAGEAGTARQAIEQARELQPDVILMDFSLPDGTGFDATQAILMEKPDAQIVFLTFHEDDDLLFAAIRLGAKGYLPKNVSTATLVKCLRGIEVGHPALTPELTGRIVDAFAHSEIPASPPSAPTGLSTRELEVLQELATGATNCEIAERLIISENTVKNHVRSILTKLNVANRREAGEFARRHGLV